MPKRRLERNINLEADLVVVDAAAAVDDESSLIAQFPFSSAAMYNLLRV